MAYVLGATYDQARRWFYAGFIDDTEWSLYCFYWRNSAPRFSDVASAFELSPTLPARFAPHSEGTFRGPVETAPVTKGW